MMNIRYRVELNERERVQLTAMLSGGKHAARKLKRGQILLAADTGIGDAAIADSVSVGGSMVTAYPREQMNLDPEPARNVRDDRIRYEPQRTAPGLQMKCCPIPR